MASQNLVSATLSAETKAEITARIAEIRSRLGFLISLDAPEIMSLVKVGKGFALFLEKAHGVVTAHPDILPGVFDVNEFKKDYQLSQDLAVIVSQVNELAEGLNNTLTAVNSDAMNAALEVYASVRQNASRVPGLSVMHDEMHEFFKKAKPKTPITA